jgi:hypothetical protein
MSSDLISPAIVKGWGCIDTFIYLHRLIEDRWKELLGTIGATEPQSFGSAYPQTLLRELAGEAKASFEGLGLKGYARGEKGIADLLNDAWKHFQSQPETFAAWEKSQIEAFRRRLGLSK